MKPLKKLAIVAAAILGLAACSGDEPATDASQINDGKPAPSFDLVDVEGNTYNLADLKGEKVYVKFWASWCSICLAGMEELNTLSGEEQDFAVLTVVSPGLNSEKNSESFIKWFDGVENVENITVLLDKDGSVADQYGVRAYPTSAYIGSDGVLVKNLPGHASNEQIHAYFDDIH